MPMPMRTWLLPTVSWDVIRRHLNPSIAQFGIRPSVVDDPYWLYMFGLINGRAERWEESLAAFAKLADLNRGHASAWHGIGWANGNLNRKSEAVAAYEHAVKLAPRECGRISRARFVVRKIEATERRHLRVQACYSAESGPCGCLYRPLQSGRCVRGTRSSR